MMDILSYQNPWWTTNKVPEEFLGKFKRDIFPTLIEETKKKEITSVLGPRRVGKTTLMHQLIDYLIRQGVNNDRILYLQFDTLEIRKEGIVKEILDIISEKLSEPLNELKDKIYLFLDEIHKLERWTEEIKQFQDMGLKIKFFVSGSSSLRILKGAGESLIGRIRHFFIAPLNFREFLGSRGIFVEPISLDFAKLKKTSIILLDRQKRIQVLFMEYMQKGGYPDIIGRPPQDGLKILIDYKDLSLQRDLFEIEGIRDIKSIRDLVNVLASLATERVNYSKLAAILGIKSDTVKRYIGLLEDIYLVYELKVFSKKPYFSVRKEKKICFLDNGMLNAINMKYEIDEEYLPKLIENACANVILANKSKKLLTPPIYYWLDEFGKEIDLVLDNQGEIIPIEVKYKNQILKKDIFTIKKFLKQFKQKKGIIVTKDTLEKHISDGKEIIYIPAWLFLLLD